MSLNIPDRRERAVVATADALLGLVAPLRRRRRRRRRARSPKRILLLRLERIGDLLMTLPAIADLRALAPQAEIDLVVGSWNADLARAIDPVVRVLPLDAAWLARDGSGLNVLSLVGAARRWRAIRYDIAINFEPDLRSNAILAASGAAWTAGYCSGGGGSLLDVAIDYDIRAHTIDNARRLVASVFGAPPSAGAHVPTLVVPTTAHDNASRLLGDAQVPLIGVHVSGGRAIKQWPSDRFAEVARTLIDTSEATIVLTGSAADRQLVETVRQRLSPERVIDVAGHLDLLTMAAVLERLDVFVTGDTGPMHLAVAVGTPVVAVFGPSDPARYGPRGAFDRIVRVDLPCSPCNRIRRPPERCVGHTPDCLSSIAVDRVLRATQSVLSAAAEVDRVPARSSTA